MTHGIPLGLEFLYFVQIYFALSAKKCLELCCNLLLLLEVLLLLVALATVGLLLGIEEGIACSGELLPELVAIFA